MPLTFAFRVGQTEKRFTEKIDKKDQLVSFNLSGEPNLVLFDPDHVILKKVDFAKPEAMWINQLNYDPHVLGRIDAAQALSRLASPKAVRALALALLQDNFWGVQVEIAEALGRCSTPAALEALQEGLRQLSHPKVRRAILGALGNFPQPQVAELLQGAYDKEASYFAEADAIRSIGRMRDPAYLNVLQALLKRDSWNDVLRNAALDAIASLKLPESIDILKEYSRPTHSPNARMTAIRNLGALGAGRDDVQQHLVRLLNDPYMLVQMTVIRALSGFADERVVPALMKLTTGDLDGRLKRTAEEAVRRIRKGMDQEFPVEGSRGKKGK
jgi:aminopeptidase N